MSCSRQDPKVLSKDFTHFGRSCCGGSWTDRKCRPLRWFTQQIWPVILLLLPTDVFLTRCNWWCSWVLWRGRYQRFERVWSSIASWGVAWLVFWLCCTTVGALSKGTEYFKATSFTLSYQVFWTVFLFLSFRFGKASGKWTKGTGTIPNAGAPGKSTAAFPHPTRVIEQG